MLYILSMVGFAASIRDEEGCLDSLHAAARGRFGPAHAETAQKAMAQIADKMQKGAHVAAS
jgi:quinol monooxygenase YgiN